MSAWYVYFVRAADGALYAGISTDVDRRLDEHTHGRGSKFLRGRGPLTIAYRRKMGEHGLALRVERGLKGLKKAEKEAIVLASPPRRALLRTLHL
jgi:putative endonuclease